MTKLTPQTLLFVAFCCFLGIMNQGKVLADGPISLDIAHLIEPEKVDPNDLAYVPSGPAFTWDPNFAIIVDNQNPVFTMTFVSPDGKTKEITYQAQISSVGLKFECTIKLEAIWFVGTDLNYVNSNKELTLGKGFELSINPCHFYLAENRSWMEEAILFASPSVVEGILFVSRFAKAKIKKQEIATATSWHPIPGILYAPFTNAPGGIVILTLPFTAGKSLSMVTGGTLTPVKA